MATNVNPVSPARKAPLYVPKLPAGAHRLGGSDLSGLSLIPVERTYRTVGDYYRNQPVDDGILTVGEYYQQQAAERARAVGRVIHGAIELAAPPILLGEMAVIKAKHGARAHDRIYNLPWDPAGRWKVKADAIKRQEDALADAEIRNLPLPTAARATGTAIVNGATAVGTAVGQTWNAVGDYASNATLEAIEASRQTGRGIMRGFLSAVAMTGQGMVDWAREHKPAFQ
ncbi:MAG: hypothetical protein FJZ01_14510 [Candidatus Sericytochromatia bacterium]|nr:hypothetical protein [Candidatus Tanganyikabacteria bacterium]